MKTSKISVLITLMATSMLASIAGAASAADQAVLKKEAKISEEKAREIALKQAPGTVKGAELEKEKGTLVWSFDIETAKGGVTEVLVSAIDGHVVETTQESAKAEAAEKAKEAKETKAKAPKHKAPSPAPSPK